MHSGNPCSSCASGSSFWAACRQVKLRPKVCCNSPGEKKKKNYDTHTLHTNMVHTREAKHAETFLWIDLDGRSILPRNEWFWLSGHEKHYVPRGYDLSATSKQPVKPTLVIVHSPEEILVGEKVCKFINMRLHLNDFVAQHDTINSCNSESLKRAIIRCYLSVDTFSCFSDKYCFLVVNHFPPEKGSGQAAAKPHAKKCFMWPRQFVLLSRGRKMGATKIGLCHLG